VNLSYSSTGASDRFYSSFGQPVSGFFLVSDFLTAAFQSLSILRHRDLKNFVKPLVQKKSSNPYIPKRKKRQEIGRLFRQN